MNALPALQTAVLDGWILRFANGYTRRANSVNPLYPGNLDLDQKLAESESFFRDRGQKVVFKMSPVSCPGELDEVLHRRGYVEEGRTSIQVRDLTEVANPDHTAWLSPHLTAEWFDHFCAMNRVAERHRPTLQQILQKVTGKTAFACLIRDDRLVACGLGVLEGDYVGLFDIVTDPQWRNQGLGQALILNILAWARSEGARAAYLQVALENGPALRLYAKLGFAEAYQYWYRSLA